MDFSTLHIFDIKADQVILNTDPMYVESSELNQFVIFRDDCQGIVTLIDNSNLMMLSTQKPNALKVDYVHNGGQIAVDTRIISFVNYPVAKLWRDWRIEDRLPSTENSVSCRPIFELGETQVYTCLHRGVVVAYAVWTGELPAPDTSYVLDLFQKKDKIA